MVAAIVAAEIVISVVQSAPDAVIVRRALLWGALGGLLAVATHGLRDRIRRSQQATARLQERVGELMVVQDRDRLAADLQSSVVQRIFAAGLNLQGVLAMVARPRFGGGWKRRWPILTTRSGCSGRRSSAWRTGWTTEGLRQQVLRLCADVSPVPEITFTGPVDEALPPEAADRLLDMLRHGARPDRDARRADPPPGRGRGEPQRDRDRDRPAAPPTVTGHGFSPLRERASQDGITIEVEPVAGGTRLAWSLPLGPGCPRAKVPRRHGERP